MPIYEYHCRKCDGVTEKIQGFNDPPLKKCPSCGGRMEKMMSPGAFILKGTGWYATDYAHRGNGSAGNGSGKHHSGAGKEPSCPASGEAPAPSCAGCPKAE